MFLLCVQVLVWAADYGSFPLCFQRCLLSWVEMLAWTGSGILTTASHTLCTRSGFLWCNVPAALFSQRNKLMLVNHRSKFQSIMLSSPEATHQTLDGCWGRTAIVLRCQNKHIQGSQWEEPNGGVSKCFTDTAHSTHFHLHSFSCFT